MVSVGLSVVCAALLYLLTSLATRSDMPINRAETVPTALGTLELATTLQEPAVFQAASEAPLFHSDRRPFLGPASVSSGDEFSDNDESAAPFELKGVVIAGGIARASLASIGGGAPVWIARGGTHEGWTLANVQPSKVILAKGEYRTTLELYPSKVNEYPEN